MLLVSLILVVVGAAAGGAAEPDRFDRALPDSVSGLKLSQPATAEVDPALFGAEGTVTVAIRLTNRSAAEVAAKGWGATAQQAQTKKVEQQQARFLAALGTIDPGLKVRASLSRALNAVIVDMDAADVAAVAARPAVVSVTAVHDYELDLFETVPYIGATAVQGMGYDGSGVRVAVLDSGIDYLHAALGGSGNPADFAANDPTIIEPGTFPTAKVVGGYDFVGSNWAASGDTEEPDPDPLDDGPGGGHGTHVAHIIGGAGGVAPGVDLYAVKVCSSISTGCSGVALIQGMEFAVDPDRDGDTSDHVDIINMSLGSDYGQPYDDDLSVAVNNASAIGVLTVASAGNSADKPYVVGTPSAAATALSVAQTAVPSAILAQMEVTAPSGIAGLYQAVFQPWSMPLTSRIEGPLQYGDGAGGNLDGCAPFAPGSLAGKVVLVDRGACNFTLKVKNVGDAGGVVGIIGLIAPGDPFEGGDGGDAPITIPGYMISQSISNTLKSGLPDTSVVFDPANGIPLVGTVVGSSSRGPRNPDSMLKPEIGAPGASVSAIAGTGTGEGPFGGTSGAAPMVSGSAALLLDASPGLSPAEAKARLMNTGETAIDTGPFTGPAPISRIGGGEVRAGAAVEAPVAAWDRRTMQGAVSFGFVDVENDTTVLNTRVQVRNYSDEDVSYWITPTFRYANDEMTGAVEVETPRRVKVKAGQENSFFVRLKIHGSMLPPNYMNSGSLGADPGALTLNEYDGYIYLEGSGEPIHLAWHVLPRKAANTVGRSVLTFDGGMDVVDLTNNGVGTAQNDAYALIALSDDLPEGGLGMQSPTPDIRAVGVNTFPVPAGFCSANESFIWAFAVNTWERQSHLLPVIHLVYLDTDRDGTDDYAVLNSDASGLFGSSDGRQLAWAWNLDTDSASAFFYAEHSTNTGNTVLYVCGEQVGLTGTDMLTTPVDVSVEAYDFYFGGPGDFVDGITITPLGERYYGIPEDIPGGSDGMLTVYDFGPWPGNSPELGLMLVTNGDRGSGARGGATHDTEALLFSAP